MNKTQVLFLCTGNSSRSQMAEGWTRHLLSDTVEPYSGGIEAHGLNPMAVEVMQESGVEISGHSSKLVSTLAGIAFDLVITVCGIADENCPAFSTQAKVVHVGFDDPAKLANSAATTEAGLQEFRRVRDEIRDFIRDRLPTLLPS